MSWEPFSPDARQVFEDASKYVKRCVCTEHLAMAIVRENSIVRQFLEMLGISLDMFTTLVNEADEGVESVGEKTFSVGVKRIIEIAFSECKRLNLSSVTPELLFLAIILEGENAVYKYLYSVLGDTMGQAKTSFILLLQASYGKNEEHPNEHKKPVVSTIDVKEKDKKRMARRRSVWARLKKGIDVVFVVKYFDIPKGARATITSTPSDHFVYLLIEMYYGGIKQIDTIQLPCPKPHCRMPIRIIEYTAL